ncbi:MAG: ABC transporter ATP-binding protein/permease [Erysipelotrichaceae bacterium]|nr:ABC transporter ATP-binding protein/permease [Erysipelotrichaceae bacterium]
MWKYVKPYFKWAVLASLLMVGEVLNDLIQPTLMSTIVDDGVLGINNHNVGDINVIITVGLLMIICTILGGTSGSLNNATAQYFTQNMGNDIRKDCFKNIMHFSFEQVDDFKTGSLITRITNDITQVQLYASVFCRSIIRNGFLMFGSMYCVFRLNHTFGLIMIASFPFILGTLIVCLYKANPLFTKLQQQIDQINNIMLEDISGIRIIKACVREIYEKLHFKKANEELVHTQLSVLIIFALMTPIMNIIMYVVVIIVLLVGNVQVSAGSTTPGAIMATITYTTQLLHAILMVVMIFQNVSRGIVSWHRLHEILEVTPQLQDGINEVNNYEGSIEFKDVSFIYPGSQNRVLKNINLKIEPGETIAIMGSTGCGKSTLVNLIMRFYDVTSGQILVDGVNVKDYKQENLRDKIAMVLQKSELFTDTIKGNIAWGNKNASDEEIINAAKIAQADEFINRMKDKYDTLLQGGTGVSGGQRQRLAIARAVVKNAEIMIFDDSTSALDLKTEANLYHALPENNTKIIIAQRIATVRHASRIIVLDDGMIVGQGTHEELMENCSIYQDIYHSQMKVGDEDE